MKIGHFILNGFHHEFCLFQDVHVQESDGLPRDFVGEFDSRMDVLHRVDEIQELDEIL